MRPILPASASKLRSMALRLKGDQTAENGTGSGSSANGSNTMPVVGRSDVAAPTMVMPNPWPTIDSNVPRPTSKRRINGPAPGKAQDDMVVDLRAGAAVAD